MSLCLINCSLCCENMWGEWRYSSILDLGIRWRWGVSFTPRLLYPRGKSALCPLDRRLGGPQSRPGHWTRDKSRAPAGNWSPIFQPIARRYTDSAIRGPTLESCKVKCKMSLCLTNKALRHEVILGGGVIDSHFLDLGTSWVLCLSVDNCELLVAT
jgi:hypothetical protein